MKKTKNYVVRKWLNKKDSAYTGSVVAFYGQSPFDKKDKTHASLEIADCRNKILLHSGRFGSDRDLTSFIKKMKKLRDVIDDYISFLESQTE